MNDEKNKIKIKFVTMKLKRINLEYRVLVKALKNIFTNVILKNKFDYSESITFKMNFKFSHIT